MRSALQAVLPILENRRLLDATTRTFTVRATLNLQHRVLLNLDATWIMVPPKVLCRRIACWRICHRNSIQAHPYGILARHLINSTGCYI
eukprot:6197111-Pleurochrysis_carterae.AAC.2